MNLLFLGFGLTTSDRREADDETIRRQVTVRRGEDLIDLTVSISSMLRETNKAVSNCIGCADKSSVVTVNITWIRFLS